MSMEIEPNGLGPGPNHQDTEAPLNVATWICTSGIATYVFIHVLNTNDPLSAVLVAGIVKAGTDSVIWLAMRTLHKN